MISNIELRAEGRRIYVIGNSFPIKNEIKECGGHWDATRKAWWIGANKRAELQSAIDGAAPSEAPKRETTVMGKAEYKGRAYYIAWMGETKHGQSARLVSLDEEIDFWKLISDIKIVKRYERREYRGRDQGYPTLAGIRDFVADKKKEEVQQKKADAVAVKTATLTPEQIMESARSLAEKAGVEILADASPKDLTAKCRVAPGEVRKSKQFGHVIVAAVGSYDRWYHSESDCEDTDCFCGEYGWRERQQYWGVPCSEPGAEKSAREAAEAAAKAKADAARAAKDAYTTARAAIPADYQTRHGAFCGGDVRFDGVLAEHVVVPMETLRSLKWEQVATVVLSVGRTGSCAGRTMDEDTLMRATLPDGRPLFREHHYRGFGDDVRETYHLPADVWEMMARIEIARGGITPERARAWLDTSRGCVGTDLYEFAASLGENFVPESSVH